MHLQELKAKSPADLLATAEELHIENASLLRKQDMMFAILKQLAENDVAIYGIGVLEVLQDGFGFLRSPEANYLPGPDDIYVSPSQIRRFALRTGDTVDGPIRGPKDGERYFALLKVNTINFEDPEKQKHKVHFDNLTPLYPDERLHLEIEVPTPLPAAKDAKEAKEKDAKEGNGKEIGGKEIGAARTGRLELAREAGCANPALFIECEGPTIYVMDNDHEEAMNSHSGGAAER